MKIVTIITLVELLALSLWMLRGVLFRQFVPTTRLATMPASLASQKPSHWTLINSRQLEGQRDDREQTAGSVVAGPETASAHRAFARRSHQMHYKQWSQGRHE